MRRVDCEEWDQGDTVGVRGHQKVVGRAGVGIDNVDVIAAIEFEYLVANAPIANTVTTVEHGIALLTAIAQNVAQAYTSIKVGKVLILFPFFMLTILII
ncbi:D-isomer specific 2-hydroxyacid dehydrogenase, catalytic domain containing protein [Parasponia andersonii]|uniref:D-isomer specific 2-hydroxyacid dehydrogenase, catalytic domain containing protein n=1 Tax=Parasponia andersonii TaxID=3476 RepID=A0A2P5B0E1_PARAD|nr:D-isomer specific 2-hydroxyacid dehydrogenase, catalytic domain containing protein [Parasponia andersonii]